MFKVTLKWESDTHQGTATFVVAADNWPDAVQKAKRSAPCAPGVRIVEQNAHGVAPVYQVRSWSREKPSARKGRR